MTTKDKSIYDSLYEYYEMITPTDKNFYQGLSLFTLSSVSTNNVSIVMPYGSVKTNLWVLLVGPSTISHKTTLLTAVMNILYDVKPDVFISEDFSPEGLFSEFSEHSNNDIGAHVVAIRDEMSGLIQAANKKDYMSNTKELLMELYDNRPFVSRRLKKERIVIKKPYFCWLTATSEQRFTDVFRETDIASGFLARFIVINFNKDNVIDNSTNDLTLISEKRAKLVETLYALSSVLYKKKFNFFLNSNAYEIYDRYINNNNFISFYTSELDTATTIKSRLSIAALKISVLLYLSDHYKEIIKTTSDVNNIFIDENYISQAIDMVDAILKKELLFLDVQLELLPTIRRILRILRHKPIISHSELLWRSHLNKSEFKNAIDTLIESEKIKRYINSDNNKIYYTYVEYVENQENVIGGGNG